MYVGSSLKVHENVPGKVDRYLAQRTFSIGGKKEAGRLPLRFHDSAIMPGDLSLRKRKRARARAHLSHIPRIIPRTHLPARAGPSFRGWGRGWSVIYIVGERTCLRVYFRGITGFRECPDFRFIIRDSGTRRARARERCCFPFRRIEKSRNVLFTFLSLVSYICIITTTTMNST